LKGFLYLSGQADRSELRDKQPAALKLPLPGRLVKTKWGVNYTS
jgi:hypothetical protein